MKIKVEVKAEDLVIGDIMLYGSYTCEVIDVFLHNVPEIGFTLLKIGDTDPKMFHLTLGAKQVVHLSLKYVLKRL